MVDYNIDRESAARLHEFTMLKTANMALGTAVGGLFAWKS